MAPLQQSKTVGEMAVEESGRDVKSGTSLSDGELPEGHGPDFIEGESSDEVQEVGTSRIRDTEVVDVDADADEDADEDADDESDADADDDDDDRVKGKKASAAGRRRVGAAPAHSKGKGKGKGREDTEEDEIVEEHPVFGKLTHPAFRADVIHRTQPDQVFAVKKLPPSLPGTSSSRNRDVRAYL